MYPQLSVDEAVRIATVIAGALRLRAPVPGHRDAADLGDLVVLEQDLQPGRDMLSS